MLENIKSRLTREDLESLKVMAAMGVLALIAIALALSSAIAI